MDEAKKKQLLVKIKAVGRTLKEYKSYKQEVEGFNETLVAQDKKQAEFYNQSKSALDSVKKSLVEFALQYESWTDENKDAIEENDDPTVAQEIQKGTQFLNEARNLLPADL